MCSWWLRNTLLDGAFRSTEHPLRAFPQLRFGQWSSFSLAIYNLKFDSAKWNRLLGPMCPSQTEQQRCGGAKSWLYQILVGLIGRPRHVYGGTESCLVGIKFRHQTWYNSTLCGGSEEKVETSHRPHQPGPKVPKVVFESFSGSVD